MAKRILIVDDAAFMRMMLKDIITKTVTRLQERQKTGLRLWRCTKN